MLSNKSLKRCFVLFLCILFIFPLFASFDAWSIENDSPIYSEIDTLYALSSLSSPNTNRPWTESQARLYLSRIDPDSLSEEGRAIYESAKEEIEEGLKWEFGDGFSLSGGITFSNEFYYHTNSDFDTEEEWVRSWNDRKPLIGYGVKYQPAICSIQLQIFSTDMVGLQWKITMGS